MVVALANVPPLRRGTPIGSSSRGDQVTMSEPFFRWLELATEVVRGTTSQTGIDALEVRVGTTEHQIFVLQSADVILTGDVLNNTNNIASMQTDITQAQTDITQLQADVTALQVGVTALQAEQFAPVWAIPQEIDDMEPI